MCGSLEVLTRIGNAGPTTEVGRAGEVSFGHVEFEGFVAHASRGGKINNEYKRLNNIVCLKVMVLWGDMELGKKPGPFGWVVWVISGA